MASLSRSQHRTKSFSFSGLKVVKALRSGGTRKRGNGTIFCVCPGHATDPIYFNSNFRQILRNAVRWTAPEGPKWVDSCPNIPVEAAGEKLLTKGPRLHQKGAAGFR